MSCLHGSGFWSLLRLQWSHQPELTVAGKSGPVHGYWLEASAPLCGHLPSACYLRDLTAWRLASRRACDLRVSQEQATGSFFFKKSMYLSIYLAALGLSCNMQDL